MMRKIFFLLIVVATNATAQTADTMNVKLKSGANIPYAVSSLNVLTFSGIQGLDTMNIKLKSGPTIRYSISLLDLIKFSNDQSSDTILIGLKEGIVRSYPVSSISTLSFIDWDKSSSIETLTPERVKQYILGQNYPNPFYPSTTIQYYLPVQQNVTLTVSTLTGQLIVSLVQEQKSAGMHQVLWDASTVPEGIYIYQLQAGEYSETKRMILLK
jgi:hypothetical protein